MNRLQQTASATVIASFLIAGCSSCSHNEATSITIWAWEPTLTKVVKAFEKLHPDITVNLENVGTTTAYTVLNNAIAANTGMPDIVQIEYDMIPEYGIRNVLTDLTDLNGGDLSEKFTTGTWSSVQFDGHVLGLPMDSGPMAMFYNADIFAKAGITDIPTTWDEYDEAAKKIRQLGEDYYIAADGGAASGFESMIRQTGDFPYSTDEDTVTINYTDNPGAQRYVQRLQKLMDEDLINTTTASWTDDWNRGLADGTIASLITGAWIPATLKSSAAAAAGQWRVAPVPQWDEDTYVTMENGGSALCLMQSTDNAKAAYEFITFATLGDGADIRVDNGAFPADTETLNDPKWLNLHDEYFGGQQINQVLAESAEHVPSGYQALPFESYAQKIFNDAMGPAWTGSISVSEGLRNWQQQLIDYGKTQGFTMIAG